MKEHIQDLIIIGGGIMGLCTAYAASHLSKKITVLEKSTVGDPKTASYGYTRSIRNDYLDPLYARLAYEARRLWLDLQQKADEPFLIQCGCLNIAKESVTPDLTSTYAEQSHRTLTDLHLKTETFTRETLQQRYPQLDADLGRLDVEAGFLYLPTITRTLSRALSEQQVRVQEHIEVVAIIRRADLLHVSTNIGEFVTHSLVITAGLSTNDILKRIDGCPIQFPLRPDRPSQCKYFIPFPQKRAMFTSEALPVFAYLDVGIYGHPIYADRTPGVKIGYYNPPDVKTLHASIHDVHSFVDQCMPSLQDAEAIDVTEVDQCFYDLVADDTFILGDLPTFSNIFVGVGWRGTGYKYAPWVGQTLSQLSLQGGTVYDISRFSPDRFMC